MGQDLAEAIRTRPLQAGGISGDNSGNQTPSISEIPPLLTDTKICKSKFDPDRALKL